MTSLTFKEIFKDYATFKAHTDNLSLYESTDVIAEQFNQHLYFCLLYRYLGCSLAYDTVDEFTAEFDIAYNQYFKQYLAKQKLNESIYNLNNEDFALIGESISNFSNNPNTITSDAWEELSYISNQNRSRTKANKITAYLNALRQMPDAQIDSMIKAFDYLWLDILNGKNIYLY